MLPGLHATLVSMVKNLGRREMVTVTVFFQGISKGELELLQASVSGAGGVGELKFREADVANFQGLRALHGDWMTYLRLYLPRLIPEADLILYLDSDLIVNTDVCVCFEEMLGNYPLGAVHGGNVTWDLDGDFFKTVGLTDDDLVFNAGVLLLNADLWRRTGIIEQTLEFGRAHSSFLRSADQTILNALFSRNFYRLPKNFNVLLGPNDQPLAMAKEIYHFVGSPKPWDFFGRFIHRNWYLWRKVIGDTRFNWDEFLLSHSAAYYARAWTLRRSYLRTLRERVKRYIGC